MTKITKNKGAGFTFGGHCSVTFDGDFINLYTEQLSNGSEAATPRVQVWACAKKPSKTIVEGVLIGEAQASVIDTGFEVANLSLTASAMTSVSGKQYIVLVVARTGNSAAFDDYVLMDEPFEFLHPRIVEPAGIVLDAEGLHASIAGIENPREEGNVSGSLVLEVWALASQDTVSFDNGTHLGGVEFITKAAGEPASEIEFASHPAFPEGKFYPALVLREWAGSGYLTRDCIIAEKAVALPPKKDIDVTDFSRAGESKPAQKAAKKATKKAAAKKAPVVKKAPAKKAAVKKAPAKKAAAKKAAVKKAPAKKAVKKTQ